MALTYAERFCRAKKAETTANLAREMYGSSFALDEAVRLSKEARKAAVTIADGCLPLNSDHEIITAMIAHGIKASLFHRHITGIGAYARNRRTTS